MEAPLESGIFSQKIEVDTPHIDVNGHVNNVVYVQWMQDIAYAHSQHVGFDNAKLAEMGSTWIIRSHSIHYRRPALIGDTVIAYTWVNDIRKASSLRKYKFVRESDGLEIAHGASDWVYLDRTNGRPRLIDDEILAAFTVVPPEGEP